MQAKGEITCLFAQEPDVGVGHESSSSIQCGTRWRALHESEPAMVQQPDTERRCRVPPGLVVQVPKDIVPLLSRLDPSDKVTPTSELEIKIRPASPLVVHEFNGMLAQLPSLALWWSYCDTVWIESVDYFTTDHTRVTWQPTPL